MSRKSSLLALAAMASLGAFALSSTDALAFHNGGMGGGGMRPGGSGMHVSGGSGLHIPPGGGLHIPPGGIGHGHGPNHIVKIPPVWFPPHHHHHWHWTWWHWHRPYWVAPVIATGFAATYATTPSYSRCTCLSKEYTPEGAVVFKDVCTNEFAMNPPAAPQQQSSLEQPAQAQ